MTIFVSYMIFILFIALFMNKKYKNYILTIKKNTTHLLNNRQAIKI